MFLYCFDEQEIQKLQKSFKLHQETILDNKKCSIFVIDQSNKINFDKIDRSKCIVTNKLMF
jgi:hypothetical protein